VPGTEDVAVVRDRSPDSQWEAARIWAAATAHRDDDPEPAPTEEALPIVRDGLEPAGASLHVARRAGRAVGFAVVVPRGEGLEILYLGVDPADWGGGVAGRLLGDVVSRARESARSTVDLWVYDDNARAVAVYERSGWAGTTDVRTHPRSGRSERRFTRLLSAGPAGSPDTGASRGHTSALRAGAAGPEPHRCGSAVAAILLSRFGQREQVGAESVLDMGWFE
jgi:ribosomal protein S18 acetylase RimI-like enzyme